jgi:hypothetical protein
MAPQAPQRKIRKVSKANRRMHFSWPVPPDRAQRGGTCPNVTQKIEIVRLGLLFICASTVFYPRTRISRTSRQIPTVFDRQLHARAKRCWQARCRWHWRSLSTACMLTGIPRGRRRRRIKVWQVIVGYGRSIVSHETRALARQRQLSRGGRETLGFYLYSP